MFTPVSCTLTKWEVGLLQPLPWYLKWQMKIAFSRFQLRNYIQIREMQWKLMQFACTGKDSWSDWKRERERMECKRKNCNLINYILNIYSSSFPPSPSDNSSFLPSPTPCHLSPLGLFIYILVIKFNERIRIKPPWIITYFSVNRN